MVTPRKVPFASDESMVTPRKEPFASGESVVTSRSRPFAVGDGLVTPRRGLFAAGNNPPVARERRRPAAGGAESGRGMMKHRQIIVFLYRGSPHSFNPFILLLPRLLLMTDPTPFFAADYFATKDVTLPRLQKFALEVIQRLTLDNPGNVFDALIKDLTAYYTALFGVLTLGDAGISLRRTGAQQMWGAIGDLQQQLEADEDLIHYKSKKDPAIGLAFFPNGRQEYGHATLLTADKLFERAANAATIHGKALGAEFDPARYTAFYQAFKAGRDGTGAGDEQSARAHAEAQHHRQDLTGGLSDAVKLVAAQFLRDEARCHTYFRVGLLQAPAPAAAKAVAP